MENAIRSFLNHLEKVKRRSSNTLIAYRSDLRQFHRALQELTRGQVALSDLDNRLLRAYLGWLEEQKYQPSTVARKWAAVRSFLKFQRARDPGLPVSLGQGMEVARAQRSKPRVISEEEVERLFAASSSKVSPLGLRDHSMLVLLYTTGLRAGNLVGLDLEDLELEDARLRAGSVSQHSLPIGRAAEPLKRYLEEGRPHLKKHGEEEAVFLNQRGRRLSRQGLWLVVKRWSMEAGLGRDVSPHTLRHSLAHHLLKQGMSRRAVQRKLRLRSPNSLRVFERGH